jgi:hypothetical protein
MIKEKNIKILDSQIYSDELFRIGFECEGDLYYDGDGIGIRFSFLLHNADKTKMYQYAIHNISRVVLFEKPINGSATYFGYNCVDYKDVNKINELTEFIEKHSENFIK